MSKIYTRTGDLGQTSLLSGARRNKNDQQVAAYGDVDELNSLIGLLLTQKSIPVEERATLLEIQAQCFTLGSHLACDEESMRIHLPPLEEDFVSTLEQAIDRMEALLSPLKTFILPGGTEAAALAHVARTVARRAERSTTGLVEFLPQAVFATLLKTLNRLSDYLFVLARRLNHAQGVQDTPWVGKKRAN